MFGNEFGGTNNNNNRSRNKAEENRIARRKLIQQQKQLQQLQLQQKQLQQQQQNDAVITKTDQVVVTTDDNSTTTTIPQFGGGGGGGGGDGVEITAVIGTTTVTPPPTVHNNNINKNDNNTNFNTGNTTTIVEDTADCYNESGNSIPLQPSISTINTSTAATTAATTTTTTTTKPTTSTPGRISSKTTNTTTSTGGGGNTTTLLSPVERAKMERQIRTQKKLENTMSMKIQAFYRQYSIQQTIQKEYEKQLQEQFSHDRMISTKEQQQQQQYYTTTQITSFVQQILFITRSCFNHHDNNNNSSSMKEKNGTKQDRNKNNNNLLPPQKSFEVVGKDGIIKDQSSDYHCTIMERGTKYITTQHLHLLQQMIDSCIIPSFFTQNVIINGNGTDDNEEKHCQQHIFEQWWTCSSTCTESTKKMGTNNSTNERKYDDSYVTRYRLQKFIQLLTICMVHPYINEVQFNSIIRFMKHIMIPTTQSSSLSKEGTKNQQYISSSTNFIRYMYQLIFPTIVTTTSFHATFDHPLIVWSVPSTDESPLLLSKMEKNTPRIVTPYHNNNGTRTNSTRLETTKTTTKIPTKPPPTNPGISSTTQSSLNEKTTINNENEKRYYEYDWILLVRHYLLFYQRSTDDRSYHTWSERVRPIPHDIDQKRDSCFQSFEKYRANCLLQFILQMAMSTTTTATSTTTTPISTTTSAFNKIMSTKQQQQLHRVTTTSHKNDMEKDDILSQYNTILKSKIVTHLFTIPLLLYRTTIPTTTNTKNDNETTTTDVLSYMMMTTKSSSSGSDNVIINDVPPPFIILLKAFIQVHGPFINILNGNTQQQQKISSILPDSDVPMTICPARPSQCLLANLIQLGRLCSSCYPGTGSELIHNNTYHPNFSFPMAAFYFDIVSIFIDIVPLSTYTTKESSAVEWISDGRGHLKPIILSNIILEQCQTIILDSFVRRYFTVAMDHNGMKNEMEFKVLVHKNDIDKQHEKDMVDAGGTDTSAASLAAKEARMKQNTSFWNTSKWAKKLTQGVTNLLSTTTNNNFTDTNQNSNSIHNNTTMIAGNGLMNTTIISRELARGGKERRVGGSNGSTSRTDFSLDLLLSLCRTYSIFLARWGGGGTYDVTNQNRSTQHTATTTTNNTTKNNNNHGEESIHSAATSRVEPFILSLLNVLTFSTPIVRILWGLIQSHQYHKTQYVETYNLTSDIQSVTDHETIEKKAPIRTRSIRPVFLLQSENTNHETSNKRLVTNGDGILLFYMFLCTFSHVLIITDDVEIHDMDKPLPLHQIRRCIIILKKLLYRAACIDTNHSSSSSNEIDGTTTTTSNKESNYFGNALIYAASKTMKDLYDRSSRRPYCVPSMWTMTNLLEKEISKCKTCTDYLTLLASTPVLRVCPFLVPFKRRLKLFDRIINTNRIEIQGENSANPFHTNPLKPGIPIRITRGRLLEDGLLTMNHLGGTTLRQRIQVQYYNEAGVRETGIDAGGLFKDFWTDLCAIAFNPQYALFRVTEDGVAGNCLYPNPASMIVHGTTEHLQYFKFLGRILGKALYEGITISPRFAHFFLSFLRGDYNFLHMLPDLSTIDPVLYNNLMFLKNYDGDCTDLSLTFTVTTDDFGGTKEIPLLPNGANIDVTNDNKQRYIGLVAKYYVFDRVKEQSEAFTRGLWDVLDRSWLKLFNEPELQVLISGIAEGKLDIDDMKAHVHYVGGYSSIDRTITKFWIVVASLSVKQQGALLRFVTGCERPPPLGFGSMNPPFTIQRVSTGGGLLRGEGERLPAASTCFNVLKLPAYGNEKILKERLIYAIESGAGFELS